MEGVETRAPISRLLFQRRRNMMALTKVIVWRQRIKRGLSIRFQSYLTWIEGGLVVKQ